MGANVQGLLASAEELRYLAGEMRKSAVQLRESSRLLKEEKEYKSCGTGKYTWGKLV